MNNKPDLDNYIRDAMDRHSHWISVADAKAGALIVAIPALLALYGPAVMGEARLQWLDIRPWDGWDNEAAPVAYLSLVAFLALSGLTVLTHAFLALNPSVDRNVNRPGTVFFGDIAKYCRSSFTAKLNRMSEADMRADYAEQIHTTARIAAAKFRHVQLSIRWLAVFVTVSVFAYIPTII